MIGGCGGGWWCHHPFSFSAALSFSDFQHLHAGCTLVQFKIFMDIMSLSNLTGGKSGTETSWRSVWWEPPSMLTPPATLWSCSSASLFWRFVSGSSCKPDSATDHCLRRSRQMQTAVVWCRLSTAPEGKPQPPFCVALHLCLNRVYKLWSKKESLGALVIFCTRGDVSC